MSSPHVPFAWVSGRPYLITNYELEPSADLPSLYDLLKGLLARNDPGDILLLRPLSRAETRLLRQSTENAEIEAWAQVAPTRRRPTTRRGRAGR